jgi:hypothetical protein
MLVLQDAGQRPGTTPTCCQKQLRVSRVSLCMWYYHVAYPQAARALAATSRLPRETVVAVTMPRAPRVTAAASTLCTVFQGLIETQLCFMCVQRRRTRLLVSAAILHRCAAPSWHREHAYAFTITLTTFLLCQTATSILSASSMSGLHLVSRKEASGGPLSPICLHPTHAQPPFQRALAALLHYKQCRTQCRPRWAPRYIARRQSVPRPWFMPCTQRVLMDQWCYCRAPVRPALRPAAAPPSAHAWYVGLEAIVQPPAAACMQPHDPHLMVAGGACRCQGHRL